MALFNECMQGCALEMLDTADIVRDGDLATVCRYLEAVLGLCFFKGQAQAPKHWRPTTMHF